jgi:hypothetical protein
MLPPQMGEVNVPDALGKYFAHTAKYVARIRRCVSSFYRALRFKAVCRLVRVFSMALYKERAKSLWRMAQRLHEN